ncbi:MAG TPA: TetR/AcrR family transcriptional regulator [Ktedonobacterales bacterium]
MSIDRISSDRRTEILEAAIRVLARDGLAQASTRKLAAEAGINQATLLYHVGSKDELLLAVLQEMMRQTREIAVAAAREDLPLREAIANSLRAFWRNVEAAPELQVMQYELTLYALRNPQAAWLAREQYRGYCEVVEGVLRAASEREGVTCALPLDALARFIVGGLDGLILQFVSDQNIARARCDLESLVAAVIALAEGSAPVDGMAQPSSEAAHA